MSSVYSVIHLYPFALGKDGRGQRTLVIPVAPSGLWECICRCRGSRFAHPRLYRSRPFRAFGNRILATQFHIFRVFRGWREYRHDGTGLTFTTWVNRISASTCESRGAHLRFSPKFERDRETTGTTGKNNLTKSAGQLARAFSRCYRRWTLGIIASERGRVSRRTLDQLFSNRCFLKKKWR